MPITYLDEEPKTKARITYLDEELPDKVRPSNISQISASALAGAPGRGVARGAQAVAEGLNIKDFPSLLFNMLSGSLAGAPGNILERPKDFAISGAPGVQANIFGEEEALPQSLSDVRRFVTSGVSEGGESLGGELEFLSGAASSAIPIDKGASKAAKVIGAGIESKIPSIKNVRNPIQFAQKVRSSMFELRSTLGKQLDDQITVLSKSNPEKRIDLSGPMQQLKAAILDKDNPGLASEIKGMIRKIKDPEIVKKLTRFIRNPNYAENVNLRTAEDMKRAISQTPSLARKAGSRFANWTYGDTEMLDLLDEIKVAQAESFPELAQVRAPYAEFMKNYRQVKNFFKPQSLIDKIKTKFGNEEIEQMVTKVLPPEIVKEIGGARKALKILEMLRKAGIAAGAGAIGATGFSIAKNIAD